MIYQHHSMTGTTAISPHYANKSALWYSAAHLPNVVGNEAYCEQNGAGHYVGLPFRLPRARASPRIAGHCPAVVKGKVRPRVIEAACA